MVEQRELTKFASEASFLGVGAGGIFGLAFDLQSNSIAGNILGVSALLWEKRKYALCTHGGREGMTAVESALSKPRERTNPRRVSGSEGGGA